MDCSFHTGDGGRTQDNLRESGFHQSSRSKNLVVEKNCSLGRGEGVKRKTPLGQGRKGKDRGGNQVHLSTGKEQRTPWEAERTVKQDGAGKTLLPETQGEETKKDWSKRERRWTSCPLEILRPGRAGQP